MHLFQSGYTRLFKLGGPCRQDDHFYCRHLANLK